MKTVRHTRGLALTTALAWGLAAAAMADTHVSLFDTWAGNGMGAWTLDGTGASASVTNGTMTVAWPQQTYPLPSSCVARRDLPAGAVLTNIAVSLRAQTAAPSAVRLVLHSRRSGRQWSKTIEIPPVGEWRTCRVDVAYARGWSCGPMSDPARFFNDMLDVDWIGVYARRSGSLATHSLSLDDFTAEGFVPGEIVDPPGDRDADGMADTWEDRYGFSFDDPADGGLDADGDGASNWSEFRAGTLPRDAGSRLTMETTPTLSGEGEAARMTISWASRSDRTYAIWRTRNLRDGFQPYASGIMGTGSTNLYEDAAATDSGFYFYRVCVE